MIFIYVYVLINSDFVFLPSELPSVQDDQQHPDLQLQVWQPKEAHDPWRLHRETHLHAPLLQVCLKTMTYARNIVSMKVF